MASQNHTSVNPIRSLTTENMAVFAQTKEDEKTHTIMVVNRKNGSGAVTQGQPGTDTDSIGDSLTEAMSRTGLF